MNVLIADDNKESLKVLDYCISQVTGFHVIGKCSNGKELKEQAILLNPDLILTDIRMPELNGIDVIRECQMLLPNIKCIFITGFDQYALEAFDLAAVDYILKPFKPARLYKALLLAKEQLFPLKAEEQNKRLQLKFNGSLYYVPLKEIIFIEKSGKKSIVYTRKASYETYENISALGNQLDNSFFQTHRSYIVNLRMISHITPKHSTYLAYFLNSKKYAHISKLRLTEFHEKLTQFL
ncbi:LytTR family DNA-binding domain-containing protein [Metabacillus sp. GX 13764]|uniref:LytR/AlgR family response regulator transcription factor n=1 Tax=Metabacillus kandeliae TaxID=2900151 RepID=UPI001E499745|nr:LytTR family DNA-binding domain-containing protein [Metabacillus kandeliae]MCD7035973.1 LytTR family DNA-binding domain-containing protein [Metabacillus kandeliae]